MSVGTIVTIVLLMAVLVLGLVMVRTIFKSSTENINAIDQKVKDQISSMFSEDDQAPLVIYPSRIIKIKKGDSESGFGLSIRNNEDERNRFSYEIINTDATCDMSKTVAENLIALGRESQRDIELGGGDVMDEPRLILFDIPESANPCKLEYDIVINKELGGNRKEEYTSQNIILEILGK